MKSVERLVRIASHYNKVKFADFYNVYSNPRIKDTRAIVYHILHKDLNFSIFDLQALFNKEASYIEFILNYHDTEYNIINHYTKIYDNTLTQFKNWNNTDLDLAYSIIKTQYDYRNDIKYEQILNENNRLEHKIAILKTKINKKSYV
jgi:hypothetical protein